jgi:5,10-methylenetetrahydromethanopterin reductase
MMRIGLDLAVNDPPARFSRVVRAVERGGFEALWLVDNGLWGRDLFVHLAWAAVLTRVVRLGPGVTHPMIRHPAVIANTLATLDELSRGRAVLGLSAGGASVVRELGCAPASLAQMRQTCRIVRRLLCGETLTDSAEGFGLDAARLRVSLGHAVPVYLGASGPAFLRLGAAEADGLFMNVGRLAVTIAEAEAHVAEGIRAAGRPAGAVERRLWLYCAVEPSKKAALAACRRGVGLLLGRYPRYGAVAGIPAATLERIAREIREAPERASPSTDDEIVDAFALAGSAREVARGLEELAAGGHRRLDLYLLSADQLAAIRALARTLALPTHTEAA